MKITIEDTSNNTPNQKKRKHRIHSCRYTGGKILLRSCPRNKGKGNLGQYTLRPRPDHLVYIFGKNVYNERGACQDSRCGGRREGTRPAADQAVGRLRCGDPKAKSGVSVWVRSRAPCCSSGACLCRGCNGARPQPAACGLSHACNNPSPRPLRGSSGVSAQDSGRTGPWEQLSSGSCMRWSFSA